MIATEGHRAVRRNGFTLVELVVVVMIMGIIAAVALPRMATSTTTTRINAAKQSLKVVREAIEIYRAETGSYPDNPSNLPTVLKPYLKGPFPPAPYGANTGSEAVAVGDNPPDVVDGGAGWAFTVSTGDFYLNDAAALSW